MGSEGKAGSLPSQENRKTDPFVMGKEYGKLQNEIKSGIVAEAGESEFKDRLESWLGSEGHFCFCRGVQVQF